MARKILAHLGNGRLSAGLWKNGLLAHMQDYAADATGLERFAKFIGTHRDPVYLVADLPEEDFRVDTVPHLRASERAALVQRRLEQWYAGTPFRRAVRLPHPNTDKRRDPILFSALTGPEHLTPWLNVLASQQAPLAGIYSVATVSAGLCRHFASNRILLLSWQKHAGLRLSFFMDGHLYFSRLAPANEHIPPARIIAEETTRTRHYLSGSGLLPADGKLDACLVCHADDRAELEKTLHNDDGSRHIFLDINELAKRAGATMPLADSDATPLLLYLAASVPPPIHYAGRAYTRFFRLRLTRRALYGIAALLAAGGLLWSAACIQQARRFTDEIHLTDEQAQHPSLQARQSALSALSSTPAEMKTAVTLYRLLDAPSPKIMLSGISNAMEACPYIQIERLSWQMDAATHRQIISLEIRLEPLSASYRAALKSLERFRTELTRQNYDVQILPPPGDAANTPPERFSLQLSRRETA